MNILIIFQILFALATTLIGLYALFRPDAIQGFTGLSIPAARGRVEMRSIFGGAFIAMGALPFLLGSAGFQSLGMIYLGIGIARAISTIVDRSTEISNLASLVIEIIFGVLLLL